MKRLSVLKTTFTIQVLLSVLEKHKRRTSIVIMQWKSLELTENLGFNPFECIFKDFYIIFLTTSCTVAPKYQKQSKYVVFISLLNTNLLYP